MLDTINVLQFVAEFLLLLSFRALIFHFHTQVILFVKQQYLYCLLAHVHTRRAHAGGICLRCICRWSAGTHVRQIAPSFARAIVDERKFDPESLRKQSSPNFEILNRTSEFAVPPRFEKTERPISFR